MRMSRGARSPLSLQQLSQTRAFRRASASSFLSAHIRQALTLCSMLISIILGVHD